MKSQALVQEPQRRTVTAAEFKAKCLQLMDEVNEKKLVLTVTKRGVPVMQAIAPATEEATFVPVWGRSPNVKILGDIVSPLDWPDPLEKWNRVNKKGKDKKRK